MQHVARGAVVLFGGLSSQSDSIFLQLIRDDELVPLVIDLPHVTARAASLPEDCLAVEPTDVLTLLDGIRAWTQRYRVLAVYNTAEAFVELAALASDYLGVPGPGLRAARVCRNKLLQRLYCVELSPPFVGFLARAPVPAFDHYPAILKPVGRRGGSGVVAVNSSAEIEHHRHNYQPDEVLLLEERIFGRDFSVETLVQGGHVLFENVTEEREDPAGRANLEMGYTLPAVGFHAALIGKAYELNRQVVSRLHFEDGILHAEYKMARDGKIYLIEAAARNPGDGLLAMYHLSTGQPMERAILDIALGRPASYVPPSRFVRQVYLESSPGTLMGVQVDLFSVAPHYPGGRPVRRTIGAGEGSGLREVRIDKSRGDRLTPLETADDRVGSVIFDANTLAELEALEQQVLANVKVMVSPLE
jgi:biotin carboxylase